MKFHHPDPPSKVGCWDGRKRVKLSNIHCRVWYFRCQWIRGEVWSSSLVSSLLGLRYVQELLVGWKAVFIAIRDLTSSDLGMLARGQSQTPKVVQSLHSGLGGTVGSSSVCSTGVALTANRHPASQWPHLGFVKEEFQVWAKPTLPHKRLKLEGLGACAPENFWK